MPESGGKLKIIVCLTCGTGTRLAIATEEGVAAAKTSIGEMPKHRGHFLDVIEATGDAFKTETEQSEGKFMIFAHALHTHRNRG